MASKTLPRVVHDGVELIQLHRGQPLRQIDIAWAPERALIKKIVMKYNDFLDVARTWYSIDTGEILHLFEDEDDVVWALPDTMENSAKYRTLKKKAERFEKLIVLRVNEFSKQLELAYGKDNT